MNVNDETTASAERPQPLAGVRVLEFGQAVSSPLIKIISMGAGLRRAAGRFGGKKGAA